ncbi:restriction endonuclease subunit S [Clostridium paraputrificum]|uniref:restriction endonuclease subunit S n=2 Tax=Clostridia TaxID=186801 RepID=UPI00232BE447|nr:restriction endonuclease subunit S [Clostridium paraputrificum]MDB2071293.1 restriction endonuclease subunit S [Clostridium paraputrificum]MDB2080709.1 restriction endonuclease subunit S [Clostridium paraputrificum]
MKKYRIDEITINLDNKRKPLNNKERKAISKFKLYPYYGANNIVDYVDEYIFDEEILCVAEDGGSWGYNEECAYIVNQKCWVNNHAHVLKAKNNLNIRYLSYYLNFKNLSNVITGTTRGKLTKSALNSIEILLPELNKQDKIVEILEKSKELMDKRKEQIEALDELVKSEFVERFPELSLFYRLFSPLNSEMICIFPYFCPYAESAREIRGIFVALHINNWFSEPILI